MVALHQKQIDCKFPIKASHPETWHSRLICDYLHGAYKTYHTLENVLHQFLFRSFIS